MNILAFAASNSRKSINKALVSYAAGLLEGGLVENAKVEIIDLNAYEMPIYSADREQEGGIPELAHQFYKKIGDADALLISYAEHNGTYTAAYKNLFDWTSRINQQFYQDKPAVLLAASPGPGGAARILAAAKASAAHFAMEAKADLSISKFYDNFDMEKGQITNAEIQAQLESALATLK